ncbi:signal transducing adapter molecule 1 isoform X2 [Venturia canescens]|uniref:signal transducing adapter molecule 1 isoform X2 n=1 Tax=Venturia canescens TaxID=32260 RepID=UPI001C9BDFD7|nr:signal transducing adapter molecule 1 isoform X2 [Venturia canescens]
MNASVNLSQSKIVIWISKYYCLEVQKSNIGSTGGLGRNFVTGEKTKKIANMLSLFTNSSPFDTDVEKATNEKNTSEDWSLIMDICDNARTSSQNAKDCLRSIVKRLNSQDPHVVMHAITLLDACSSNCGKTFHLEIASRDFEGELRKLIQRSQQKIVDKLKALLKKWAEGDFKSDPQLNLIPTLYNKLKSEGIDFSGVSETSNRQLKHSGSHGRDANAAATSQEFEDIAKAIELSLKETKQSSGSSHSSPSSKKSSSLYPNVNSSLTGASNAEGRKVRALYDFEAAEDNELSFFAGDIIHILDDSDPNWWKGTKNKSEGLFPSNFVTADLSVEPEQFIKLEHGNKKSVQFSEEVEVKTVKREPEIVEVEIDEAKIDRLLHLLHEADPQSDVNDPPEMLELEEQVTAMGPLIDAALEKVDRRHAQLTQLSSDLVDALNLYHTLMRDPPHATPTGYTLPKMPPGPMNVYPYPGQPAMYNGMPGHPQAGYGAGAPGHYNPNMPGMPAPSEYMPGGPGGMTSMPAMPHNYHVPPGPHQHPPVHPQAGLPPGVGGHPQVHPQGPPQIQDPGAMAYQQPQPFPPQGVPGPVQYVQPVPPGVVPMPQQQQQQQHLPQHLQQQQQQQQYAPTNGQHIM